MKKVPVWIFILLISPSLFATEEDMSISGGGWYGWGASLDDYYLSGSSEALDLEGPVNGGNIRLIFSFPENLYTTSLWFDYTGSYLLTGSQYDVLRRVDLAVGASIRLSAFQYIQPFLSVGFLRSDYLLFLPYHPLNSTVLYFWGFRLTGGILSELFTLNFMSFELGFQIGPEYVLEIFFSDTVVFLHEVRARLGIEIRVR